MAEITRTSKNRVVCAPTDEHDFLFCQILQIPTEDITDSGLELLPSFWEDKQYARGLLQSLLNTFKNPLDLAFQIIEKTALFDAEGYQLDLIGKLWSTPRRLSTDVEYRDELFKIITQDTSDGTPEVITSIIKAYVQNTNVILYEHLFADIHVFCDVGYRTDIVELGNQIKPVGVTFSARFPPYEDGQSGVKPSANAYVTEHNLLNLTILINDNLTITPSNDTAPDGSTI